MFGSYHYPSKWYTRLFFTQMMLNSGPAQLDKLSIHTDVPPAQQWKDKCRLHSINRTFILSATFFFWGACCKHRTAVYTHTQQSKQYTCYHFWYPSSSKWYFFSLMCFSGVLPHHYSNHFPSQQTLSDIILCHVTLMNPLAVKCDTRFDFISMLDSQQFIKSSLNITIRETEVCVRTLACMRVCVCERECEWL